MIRSLTSSTICQLEAIMPDVVGPVSGTFTANASSGYNPSQSRPPLATRDVTWNNAHRIIMAHIKSKAKFLELYESHQQIKKSIADEYRGWSENYWLSWTSTISLFVHASITLTLSLCNWCHPVLQRGAGPYQGPVPGAQHRACHGYHLSACHPVYLHPYGGELALEDVSQHVRFFVGHVLP